MARERRQTGYFSGPPGRKSLTRLLLGTGVSDCPPDSTASPSPVRMGAATGFTERRAVTVVPASPGSARFRTRTRSEIGDSELAASGESQCHALLGPCEWEAGVGHQLARREIDRLATIQDRDDDVRREKIQPDQSRRIGRPHAFLRADVFQIGGRARCEAASERMGADQEADKRGVGRRSLVCAIDDEFHLLAGPLELGRDRQPEEAVAVVPSARWIGSVGITSSLAIVREVGPAMAGQERLRDHRRPQVDVDPIRVNLDLGDERAKDRETLVLAGRDRWDDTPCGSERALDARRIAALRRQRLCDGDGIGEESSQTLDNETLELGGRKTLAGLMTALCPDAGDQPA